MGRGGTPSGPPAEGLRADGLPTDGLPADGAPADGALASVSVEVFVSGDRALRRSGAGNIAHALAPASRKWRSCSPTMRP